MAVKKCVFKQKIDSVNYDIIHFETEIDQVLNLQTILDSKVNLNLSEYSSTMLTNDALFYFYLNNTPSVTNLANLASLLTDSHNLGWYATPQALQTAHSTAVNGDFAIVGSTDTIWTWDSDISEWVNTNTDGLVTSVNGQTGAVTVSTPGNLTCGSGTPENMSNNINLSTVAKSGSYNDLIDKPSIQSIIVSANQPANLNENDFWLQIV